MENDRILRQAQDRAYFAQREEQERSAADHAKGKAREAHERMAELYHELSRSAEDAEDAGQVEPTRTPVTTPAA